MTKLNARAKKSITDLVEMHKRLLLALEERGAPFAAEQNYHEWSQTVLNAMTLVGDLSEALCRVKFDYEETSDLRPSTLAMIEACLKTE